MEIELSILSRAARVGVYGFYGGDFEERDACASAGKEFLPFITLARTHTIESKDVVQMALHWAL
jgi:hypothetical protein